jgi:hypothetical protein
MLAFPLSFPPEIDEQRLAAGNEKLSDFGVVDPCNARLTVGSELRFGR